MLNNLYEDFMDADLSVKRGGIKYPTTPKAEETPMSATINFETVIAEARKIATERPDFNYQDQQEQSGLHFEDPEDCSYLGLHRDVPDQGEGCIFGQALTRLGVPREELAKHEGQPIGSVIAQHLSLTDSDIALLNHTEYRKFAIHSRWVNGVQRTQDEGYTWGDAIKAADNVKVA